MGHAFELAELACFQKWKRIFHVGGADRVMAQLVFGMISQLQLFAAETQVEIPIVAAVAPIGVPLERLRRMTEELHFHLFEFARTKGEISRRDLVAETFSGLRDAKRD